MKKQISLLAIIVAVASAFFGFLFFNQTPDAQTVIERARAAQLEQCKLPGKTPGGVSFRAVAAPSAEIKAAIDRAWSRNDLIAAYFNYSNNIGRDKFLIYLIPEERLSYGGVPSLIAPIGCGAKIYESYCGGEFEKGELPLDKNYLFDERGKVLNRDVHYITVSERVINETLGSDAQAYTVVVPRDESESNLRLVEQSIVNGFEHFAKFNNDRSRFDQTVGAGRDIHPDLIVPGVNE